MSQNMRAFTPVLPGGPGEPYAGRLYRRILIGVVAVVIVAVSCSRRGVVMMPVVAVVAPFPVPGMLALVMPPRISFVPLPTIVPVPDLLSRVVPAPAVPPVVIRPRRCACKEQPCSQSSDQ